MTAVVDDEGERLEHDDDTAADAALAKPPALILLSPLPWCDDDQAWCRCGARLAKTPALMLMLLPMRVV
jgi:hypothetical protein